MSCKYDDETLMRGISYGNKGALDVLLDRYLPLVSRTSYRILCDRAGSEEVTVEVFVKLCRHASDYDSSVTLSVWIYRLVCHACIVRLMRDRIRDIFKVNIAVYETSAPYPPSPEEDFIAKESWEIFCRASRGLSLRQRIVYTLCELEGLAKDEVRSITGYSYESVKENIFAARQKIRQELEYYGKVR
jgi:RNA polymerase sigma-70 factor (ECF subfamily)